MVESAALPVVEILPERPIRGVGVYVYAAAHLSPGSGHRLCVLGAGQEREAATQFAKAIELDPNYADAHLQRANLLRGQGFLEGATRAYTQTLAFDPLNSTIAADQAILIALQGRFERAFEQLEPLLAEDSARLSVTLSMSKVATLAGQAERSLRLAHRAQSLAPENPLALTRVIEAYMQLGRLDDAEASLNQARVIAPENEAVIQVTLQFQVIGMEMVILHQEYTVHQRINFS